jgi:translocation and assembly module TamB
MTDDTPDPVEETPQRRGSRWQRNLLIGLLCVLLVVGGALLWLDTSSGHRFLVSRITRIEPSSGLRIDVERIDGSIYSKAVLRGLKLSDPKGAFFSAPEVQLDWWPFAWAYNRLDIDRLVIPNATLHKLPKLNPSKKEGPILPDFDIRLMELRVDRLTIAKAVSGREQVMSLAGDADVRSGRAIIDLRARSLTGSDALLLALDSRPDDDRFDLDLTANAPKGGVIGAMAGLKQDGNLRVQGKGSWTAWKGQALATLDGKPAVALKLGANKGVYRVDGTIEGAAIAGAGLLQRMTAPRLALTATGTFEDRVLRGEVSAKSPAIALGAKGGVDLRGNGFDNLEVDQIGRAHV